MNHIQIILTKYGGVFYGYNFTNGIFFERYLSETSQDAQQKKFTSALFIKSASTEDSGLYSCKATNPHGSAHQEYQLLVQGEHK